MDKEKLMRELLDRYQQLNFIDDRNRYVLEERINKLERMLKELLY